MSRCDSFDYLWKSKPSDFLYSIVGRVCVHMCMYVRALSKGSCLTNQMPLLPFILAAHETRINGKSIFSAFNFFIIFFSLRTACPSNLLHFFSWGFLNWQNYRRFHIQHFNVSRVLFFIFWIYHKKRLKQFHLFVHLIAQWGSNWDTSHYWADAIII